MKHRKNPLERMAVTLGAIALSTIGMVGLGTAATADGFTPPDHDGTLTLHKHVMDDASTDGNPAGEPLAGVTFSVQEIGVEVDGVCTAIDLGTPAGWQQVDAAVDAHTTNPGAVPTGYCALGTALTGVTDASGATPFEALRGLYLVTETDPGPNMISQPAAPFLVTVPMPSGDNTWVYDVNAYPKNELTTTTPTKTVAANNGGDTPLVPGATVPWTITVPIPVAAFPYHAVTVTDVPTAGLTFSGFGALALNGTPLDAADYTISGTTVTLTASGLAKVNALVTGANAAEATLTADATTTVDADIDPGSFTNRADVTLNGTTTPTDQPRTLWGLLSVLKHKAGSESTVLAGAEFAVYAPSADGTCAPYQAGTTAVVASGTTGSDGTWEQVLWIANVQSDNTAAQTRDYCLVETAAPAGYILDSAPRLVTLSSEAPSVTTYKFPNTPPNGPDLPLTGAGGTVAMALAGIGLVGIGTGAIVVSRRRRSNA